MPRAFLLDSLIPIVSPNAALVGTVPVPYGALWELRTAALFATDAQEPQLLRVEGGAESQVILAPLGEGIVLLASPGGEARLVVAKTLANYPFDLEGVRPQIAQSADELPPGCAELRWARGELGEQTVVREPFRVPLVQALKPSAEVHTAVIALGTHGIGADWQSAAASLEQQLGDDVLLESAALLSRLGAAAEAVRIARVIAARGDSAPARRALALGLTSLCSQGQAGGAEALDAVRRALEDEPDDAELKASLVRACLVAGGSENLELSFRVGHELWLAREGGRIPECLARIWEGLANIGPADPRVQEFHNAWETKEYARAAELGQALLEQACYDEDVHMHTAQALVLCNRFSEAIQVLRGLVAARPDHGPAWAMLLGASVLHGVRTVDRAALEEAATAAGLAAELHPHDLEVLLSAAETLCVAGRFTEALDVAWAARRAGPVDDRTQTMLNRIVEAQTGAAAGQS